MSENRRLRQGKARLLRAVLEGYSVSKLISLGEEILGFPLALSTVNHFVWYASGAMPQNPILPRTGAATITTQVLFDEAVDAFLEADSPQLVRAHGGYHYCFCALRAGKKLRGYAVMVSASRYLESDRALLQAFCDILAEEMEKQNVVRRVLMLSEEESTLMHILENTATEHGTYDIESLFPVGTRYVELISVRYQSGGNIAPDIGVVDAMRELLGCDICFGYRGGLVLVAPMGTFAQHRDALSGFLNDRKMLAGVSYPCVRLGELKDYYKQAEKALNYSGKINKKLVFYSEIVYFDLLDELPETFQTEMLCNFDIKKLDAYDKQHGTDYCRTLRAYIYSGFNAVETAKMLGIHRNSVLARMNKIYPFLQDESCLHMDGLLSAMILEHAKFRQREETVHD